MQPWDQQLEESDKSYAHFLAFRNLGPMRNVSAAYRAVTGREGDAPGNWAREAERFDWRSRASKWDIAQLSIEIPEFAVRTLRAIGKLGERTLEALEDGTIRPTSWPEVVEAVKVLATYISPETFTAIYGHAANAGALTPGDDQPPALVEATAGATDGSVSDGGV